MTREDKKKIHPDSDIDFDLQEKIEEIVNHPDVDKAFEELEDKVKERSKQ